MKITDLGSIVLYKGADQLRGYCTADFTVQLIYTFGFCMYKSRFSHDTAQSFLLYVMDVSFNRNEPRHEKTNVLVFDFASLFSYMQNVGFLMTRLKYFFLY